MCSGVIMPAGVLLIHFLVNNNIDGIHTGGIEEGIGLVHALQELKVNTWKVSSRINLFPSKLVS